MQNTNDTTSNGPGDNSARDEFTINPVKLDKLLVFEVRLGGELICAFLDFNTAARWVQEVHTIAQAAPPISAAALVRLRRRVAQLRDSRKEIDSLLARMGTNASWQ
jgi:hypothetical protein